MLLNGILRLVDWTYNSFLDVLQLLTYARVNPLYADSKAVACCKGAQFAYNEWCATTAYGERTALVGGHRSALHSTTSHTPACHSYLHALPECAHDDVSLAALITTAADPVAKSPSTS